MPIYTAIAVRCQIARGGFSGERVVTIQCADGSKRKGMAPTNYCWNSNKKPLSSDEPENGNPIDGYVAARLSGENDSNSVTIEIPDGEVMTVPRASIIDRPSAAPPSEVASHVSVGS